MSTSTAVGLERISRVVGYQLTKGQFNNSTPNLPQRIAILGEANTANQSGLDLDGFEATTLQQVGERYGYGSPIYSMMRILRPTSSDGIGGIPTIIFPQEAAGGSTASVLTITPTGTATANATHTVEIAGRTNLDGDSYDVNIAVGDTVADITAKITDVINNVLAAPVSAVDGGTLVTCTTKWTGATSAEVGIVVNTNGIDAGIAYGVVQTTPGAGTPTVTDSLDKFGSEWFTVVLNPYGSNAFDELEAFNGRPDDTTPTGRYQAVIMKPFIAFYGDLTEDPTLLTDVAARKIEVTNSVAPAPNSPGCSWEAAANMALLDARIAQDNPHLDVNGKYYSDMPVPADGNIGPMSQYNTRDSYVKKGSSTVDFVAGNYQIQDLVTTYHPDGETPPAFRYVRNLFLDFNVRYGYYLLEQINVVDKAIANDIDTVRVQDVVKPKQWKGILFSYADDLAERALIADPDFMKENTNVSIGTTNPDRLETFFRYKRTGVARISSTTAEAGFNFGNI